MMHCGVECLILNVDSIFDNTFNGVFPWNSMWTVPWNPYGIVHGFPLEIHWKFHGILMDHSMESIVGME